MLRAKTIKPAVLYVGDDHCAAVIGPILAMVVRTDPSPGIIEQQKSWMSHLRANAPGGSAFVTVLRSDTPPPTEEARALIKRVFRTFGEVVKAGAMVIEGKGFVAATFRSVLSMILLALKPNYPFKIFASIEEGLTFALEHVEANGVTVSDILIEFERIKTEYQAGTLVVSR